MAGWWLAIVLTFSSCLGQKPIFPDLPNPRIVIVGPSGAGKSSLANAFLGCDPRAPDGECMFGVGNDQNSCTKNTTYGTGRWLGTGQNFTVVDTPGFKDSDGDGEALIEEMMDVLANQVNHADTMLLLFNGGQIRFDASLQDMLQKMTLIFGQDWWNFVVIGVSFWAYDQDSIDDRNDDCEDYPDSCKDEASFTRDINEMMQEKMGVNRNFTFVFTDSWSQTSGHKDDPLEQEHWLEETGKLWEITTNREKSFDFMTIDDILEENARQRAEIKWLNDVIANNISDIMARLEVNSGKIEDNQVESAAARAELDKNIAHVSDTLGVVNGRVTLNEDNLEAVSGRVTLNEEDIDDLEVEVKDIVLAPLGTITAWVTKPSAGGESTNLPNGWVKCDGRTIPHPSIWAGQLTPDLNHSKRFLRGGSDADQLKTEPETTRMVDHFHIDTGHHHSATSTAQDHDHEHTHFEYFAHAEQWECGGHYWTCPGSKSATTDKAKVTVTTTVKSATTGIRGVQSLDSYADETKPINMNVIYIMRVW